jgi:hypothetical protein
VRCQIKESPTTDRERLWFAAQPPALWTREVVPQNVEAGLGSVKRRFVMHEAILQHLARLLLPRPIRVLEPLAHLLEGGRIVVASCVPLTQEAHSAVDQDGRRASACCRKRTSGSGPRWGAPR